MFPSLGSTKQPQTSKEVPLGAPCGRLKGQKFLSKREISSCPTHDLLFSGARSATTTAGQRPELGTFLPGGPVPERERRSEGRVKAEKCVYDVCGALGNSDEG